MGALGGGIGAVSVDGGSCTGGVGGAVVACAAVLVGGVGGGTGASVRLQPAASISALVHAAKREVRRFIAYLQFR